MHVSGRKSFDHDTVYCMPVEKNFESDRGMNCLDILAGVVSRCSSSEIEQNPSKCAIIATGLDDFCRIISERDDSPGTQEHRVSCHRCGNIRKRKIVCVRPQVPLTTFCYDLTTHIYIIPYYRCAIIVITCQYTLYEYVHDWLSFTCLLPVIYSALISSVEDVQTKWRRSMVLMHFFEAVPFVKSFAVA